MRYLCPLLVCLALAVSCRAAPAPGPSLSVSRSPAPAATPDLLGWDEISPLAFERLVETQLPEDRVTELDEFQIADCERMLDVQDALSVRAAVILGRSRCARAGETLLARLEKRVLGAARNADAGDTVAAAALAGFPDGAKHADRLAALAQGANPHPDLEVRVECAGSALLHGRDEVIPFLLAVLLVGTPKGLENERDFAVSDTTAWARGRAAIALSRRAEVPVTYRTDSALADREEETEKLARALRAMGRLD